MCAIPIILTPPILVNNLTNFSFDEKRIVHFYGKKIVHIIYS